MQTEKCCRVGLVLQCERPGLTRRCRRALRLAQCNDRTKKDDDLAEFATRRDKDGYRQKEASGPRC